MALTPSELGDQMIAFGKTALLQNQVERLTARNTEMEAGLNHIIKWCKQSHSLFSVNQLAKAIGRMCKDVLQENET